MKIGSSSSSDSDSDNGEDRQDDQTLTAQFEDIIQQLKNMIYILNLQHCTVYLTDFWRRWKLVVIVWWCWVPNWSLMRPAILPNATCQSGGYLTVARSTTRCSQARSRGDAMQQACGYKLVLLGSWRQKNIFSAVRQWVHGPPHCSPLPPTCTWSVIALCPSVVPREVCPSV